MWAKLLGSAQPQPPPLTGMSPQRAQEGGPWFSHPSPLPCARDCAAFLTASTYGNLWARGAPAHQQAQHTEGVGAVSEAIPEGLTATLGPPPLLGGRAGPQAPGGCGPVSCSQAHPGEEDHQAQTRFLVRGWRSPPKAPTKFTWPAAQGTASPTAKAHFLQGEPTRPPGAAPGHTPS